MHAYTHTHTLYLLTASADGHKKRPKLEAVRPAFIGWMIFWKSKHAKAPWSISYTITNMCKKDAFFIKNRINIDWYYIILPQFQQHNTTRYFYTNTILTTILQLQVYKLGLQDSYFF